MATLVTVNGNTYSIPSAGEDPDWSEDLSAYLVDLAEIVNSSISGAGEIVLTSFPLSNSQTASFANISGFLFDQTQVRAVTATYRIQRTDGSNYLVEKGNIELIYNPQTSAWTLERNFIGDGQVYLDVTSGGQLQYKVIALSGQTDGFIRFETVATLT